MAEDKIGQRFWQSLQAATDVNAYRPVRSNQVEVARLEAGGEPYYVLKEPNTRSYLRLSEGDYALWWQMDGRKSLKDLLFYNLLRYKSLPVGHVQQLVENLKGGCFLADKPTYLYKQLAGKLEERAPTTRGKRLLQGFLHTEIALDGLDDFFTPFYERVRWLFWPIMQVLLLLLILLGGIFYGRIFLLQKFSFSGGSGWGLLIFMGVNLFVITIHELAHGLTTKHYGRELNRGGFLIYWGFPAFFVDTRDMWLTSNRARMAVAWAGPHSGLVLGGVAGCLLVGLLAYYPDYKESLLATIIYQVGFIAYLTVFVNLNPLMELDGYFILMDGLEMPGLRRRAFAYWREIVWARFRERGDLWGLWQDGSQVERIFMLYGGLALVYATYALGFALYFWRTRLIPFVENLWRAYGLTGQLLVLLVIVPVAMLVVYYLLLFSWGRIQAGLNWLARRDLLARPDVLALLTGIPLLVGLPLVLAYLTFVSENDDLWQNLLVWLIHLTSMVAFGGVARQLAGSRFQWVLWSLVGVQAGLAFAWMGQSLALWHDLGLVVAAGSVLAAGMVAWFTVLPQFLSMGDKVLMGGIGVVGLLYGVVLWGRLPLTLPILVGIFVGLVLMGPLLLNFYDTYFGLPWLFIAVACLALPWLQFYPFLHIPVGLFWLYVGLLYLLLGALAEFKRHTLDVMEIVPVYSGRARLINSFNHFMTAMFASYEAIFWAAAIRYDSGTDASVGGVGP